MLHIGLDDTDGQGGMCTTYLVNRVLEVVGYPPADLPRLIRLNPNIPWRTRGNGAVSILLDAPESVAPKVLDTIADVVRKTAFLDEENTNPGIVVSPVPLSIEVYWNAVRSLVTIEDARETIRDWGAEAKGFKNCRGLIGAAAAVAWHPDLVDDVTYEVIAYRSRENWGTPRTVDVESVRRMSRECRGTFNNIDERNNHVAISPNTPCPILFGIRGNEYEEVLLAKDIIRGEEPAGWTLFMSNQGTDDHIVERSIADIAPMETPVIRGTVSSNPHTIQGGHVFFSITDVTGEMPCGAYEPTKEFREIVALLRKGDEVVVVGSIRKEPTTVNLEKLLVLDAPRKENPRCPRCNKSMSSSGKSQGFRCKKCGEKAEEKIEKEDILQQGAYQVPVCARRHLMRPLERGLHPILKSYI